MLYRFGKQDVTFGPLQFEARVNQDTEISRELTLWSQQGSRVIRGNLIIVPIADTLLYVEPLFLQAEQGEIPELKRVIVGTGHDLVMRPTFWEALSALVGEDLQERPGARGKRSARSCAASRRRRQPRTRRRTLQTSARSSRGRSSSLTKPKGPQVAATWSAYGQALDRLGHVLRLLRELASRVEVRAKPRHIPLGDANILVSTSTRG